MNRALTVTITVLLLQAASPVFAERKTDGDRSKAGTSYDRGAETFRKRRMYTRAESLMKRSLAYKEKVVGPDTPEVAVSLNNLAMLYQELRQYVKAEPLHLRALEIRVKALGLEHPEVATTLSNLTSLYKAQGQQAKADALPARAKEIWAKAQKPDKPKVAPRPTIVKPRQASPPSELSEWDTVNQELMELCRVPNYRNVVVIAKKALAVAERDFGPNHPNTARSLNNLAFLYKIKDQHALAEPLYIRALGIWKKVKKPDHRDVALTMDNLARLYKAQRRYGRVEALNKRTLEERAKIAAPNRPDLSTVPEINKHTRVLGEAEAEPFNLVLRKTFRVYGPNSVGAANKMVHLARNHQPLGQFTYAEILLVRALENYKKELKPPHHLVAETMFHMGQLYASQGQFAKPEQLFKQALKILEEALKPNDPHYPKIAWVLKALKKLYITHAHRAHVAELEVRIMAVNNSRFGQPPPSAAMVEGIIKRERMLAEVSPDAVTNLTEAARVFQNRGQDGNALPLYRSVLAILEKAQPPDHLRLARTLGNLGLLYHAQRQYALAEPLYLRALDTLEKNLPGHPDVAGILNKLAKLYEAQGQTEKARTLSARASVISKTAKPIAPPVRAAPKSHRNR